MKNFEKDELVYFKPANKGLQLGFFKGIREARWGWAYVVADHPKDTEGMHYWMSEDSIFPHTEASRLLYGE